MLLSLGGRGAGTSRRIAASLATAAGSSIRGALAGAGQHEQAKIVARSIINPDQRAQALTAVVKALVARGDTRQAHHVASVACAAGRWTTVLELVLWLEPSALGVLTDL